MNKNIILSSMILCYIFPISYIYINYRSGRNESVSNVICDEKCKHYIFFSMLLMGAGTLLYEIERGDIYSQIIIVTLLIGLYCLISFDETYKIHYFFACQVFFAIMLFMIHHLVQSNYNIILLVSLSVEVITLLMILKNLKQNIFIYEVFYILNFAFYYLYLHII